MCNGNGSFFQIRAQKVILLSMKTVNVSIYLFGYENRVPELSNVVAFDYVPGLVLAVHYTGGGHEPCSRCT